MTPPRNEEHLQPHSPHTNCLECGRIKQQIQTLEAELTIVKGDVKTLTRESAIISGQLNKNKEQEKSPLEGYTGKIIIGLISVITLVISTIGSAIVTFVFSYLKGEIKLP